MGIWGKDIGILGRTVVVEVVVVMASEGSAGSKGLLLECLFQSKETDRTDSRRFTLDEEVSTNEEEEVVRSWVGGVGVLVISSSVSVEDATVDVVIVEIPTVVQWAVLHLYVFSGSGAVVGHGSLRQVLL